MTRTTNARIAGFTYLFYAAIGICIELLMHQARGVGGGAAELVRIGQHATNVRLSILIVLLECFSALVLGTLSIPNYLGLLWLAKPGAGTGAPDITTTNALRTFLLMPVPSVPLGTIFFAVGSLTLSYLLLRGRMVPVSIAWLGVFASGVLVVALPLAGFPT